MYGNIVYVISEYMMSIVYNTLTALLTCYIASCVTFWKMYCKLYTLQLDYLS